MLKPLTIPTPQPVKKVPGYEMSETSDHLLEWQFVVEQMQAAENYWIACINGNGAPHVVPLWGIWFENRVHFDGSPETGWAKNLFANGEIAVHLPSADQVVIINGYAQTLGDDEFTESEWALLDGHYQKKYGKYNLEAGSPYWYVQPSKVIAWKDMQTMTRWIFPKD